MEQGGEQRWIGKYSSAADAVLDAMAQEGWASGSPSGDVECATGWYAMVRNERAELESIVQAFEETINETGCDPADLIGYFMVRTDSQGFVTVDEYESQAELQAAFDELDRTYSEWLGQDDEPHQPDPVYEEWRYQQRQAQLERDANGETSGF